MFRWAGKLLFMGGIMDFVTAVKTCFQKYVTYSGRAQRSEFWWWILFTIIASMVAAVVDQALFLDNMEKSGPLEVLFSLGTLLPGIFVSTRRLHDVNRSGWWQLIAVTIIGLIPLIFWFCSKGTTGDNRFGPDPLVVPMVGA
jgi:uncharacterized membrane protein YhaH (DUF805 family)